MSVSHATSATSTTSTYFVLPPRHRLFAIFDRPEAGREAIRQLADSGLVDEDEVWTFCGEQGLRSLDPDSHHGVSLGIVRFVQRALTNDCEYCEELTEALGQGAMVVAVKAKFDEMDPITDALRRHGGRDLAFGAHWNFVPVAG